MPGIGTVDVAAWAPVIALSDQVAGSPRIEQFAERARSAYVAPAITFAEPQAMLVGGRHFAVVTERGGLIETSVHTLPRFRWRQAFEPVARIAFGPETPALIAASAGHGNYFHWMTETVAAALARRLAFPGEETALVVPPLDGWQRDALAAFGLRNPLLSLPGDEALVLDAGVLISLIGPGHAFAPHPAMLDLFRRAMPETAEAGTERVRRRRLYLARSDAGDRRRMLNEPDLCAMLAAQGFEIVRAGELGIAAQAALFRQAELIVAPHGAALTNLLFCEDGAAGPAVIELFQENYLNRCFTKICQAKHLHYRALVNPCVSPGPHHHQSTWRADIPLIRGAIADSWTDPFRGEDMVATS